MRKFLEILIAGVCSIYLLGSCNGCGDSTPKTDKPIQMEISPVELVEIWNDANNNKDINAMKKLYDSVVHFYQRTYSADECIKSKIAYFEKYPDFRQSIEGNLFVDSIKEGFVRINFMKMTVINNEASKVAAYLVFNCHDGVWKIYAESDLTTDRLLSPESQVPSNAIEGDFNGDGVMDYMWLETLGKSEECRIRFSGSIPPLVIGSCIGGSPVNESDLNDDGADEVGLLPVWESSCWKVYFVYTFKENQWVEALDPVSTHCIQWEKNIMPVVKDTIRKGYVFVNYSDLSDDGIDIKTKSVKVR
jgi:predicted ester cyclase